jgi:hypothetical protein
MTKEPLVIKNPRGWFAAGIEVQKALNLLSDGAFKLFMYLCLNARRDSGRLESSLTQLARSINKAQQTVRLNLREMEKAGICRFQFSHNPRGSGFVEIDAEYWPYLKPGQDPQAEECAAFVGEIRKMLQARACVQSLASTADEILARQWLEAGISLERIEQAILMGCIRKYVSWRNNQTRTLIGSLQYFAPVLEEVRQTKVDPDYWGYLRYRLVRMENEWKLHRGEHPDKGEVVQEQII